MPENDNRELEPGRPSFEYRSAIVHMEGWDKALAGWVRVAGQAVWASPTIPNPAVSLFTFPLSRVLAIYWLRDGVTDEEIQSEFSPES